MNLTPTQIEAIGWKHGHPAGITTRAGVLTEFPAGLSGVTYDPRTGFPVQADIDRWALEFAVSAWLKQPDQAGDVTDPGGQLRQMARAHVLATYTVETQLNFATGLYADPDELEVYRQFVADTITEYHRVRDLIVAAPDEAAINAAVATLSWPTPPA